MRIVCFPNSSVVSIYRTVQMKVCFVCPKDIQRSFWINFQNEQETAVRTDVESRNYVEAIPAQVEACVDSNGGCFMIFWTVERVRFKASATRRTLVLACTHWMHCPLPPEVQLFSIASAEIGFLPLPERTFNNPVSSNLVTIN
ncbi:hypothetical protein TNCV_2983661 [Trichonephila clavipes]|nr:hypothetical protein TNCV_2983661 [Trichonephila clavipes]